MKNILVTGGCGFIGTNFIRYLLSNPEFDGRVINIDKLTYAGNLKNLISVEKKFRERYIFIQADICDSNALKDVFETYAPDTICHFAAESHVDRSIAAPDAFIKTNIEGTFCLLETARQQQNRLPMTTIPAPRPISFRILPNSARSICAWLVCFCQLYGFKRATSPVTGLRSRSTVEKLRGAGDGYARILLAS